MLELPSSVVVVPFITTCGGPVLAMGDAEKVPERAILEVKVKPTGRVTVTGVPVPTGKDGLTTAPAGTPLIATTKYVGLGVKVNCLAAVSTVPGVMPVRLVGVTEPPEPADAVIER